MTLAGLGTRCAWPARPAFTDYVTHLHIMISCTSENVRMPLDREFPVLLVS